MPAEVIVYHEHINQIYKVTVWAHMHHSHLISSHQWIYKVNMSYLFNTDLHSNHAFLKCTVQYLEDILSKYPMQNHIHRQQSENNFYIKIQKLHPGNEFQEDFTFMRTYYFLTIWKHKYSCSLNNAQDSINIADNLLEGKLACVFVRLYSFL